MDPDGYPMIWWSKTEELLFGKLYTLNSFCLSSSLFLSFILVPMAYDLHRCVLYIYIYNSRMNRVAFSSFLGTT